MTVNYSGAAEVTDVHLAGTILLPVRNSELFGCKGFTGWLVGGGRTGVKGNNGIGRARTNGQR